MKKKLLLGFIFLLIISVTNCYASTKTYDRNELENYGVNKGWKITESNKKNILNTPAVDASEKIYDYGEILSEEEEKELKGKIDEFIQKTNMDMVIVIPNFTYYDDNQNEDYAADFYDYNDFGMKYKNNSGVLFLRNVNESDPYYNIYTFGDAQLYFNYDRLETILDSIYDEIHSGNYVSGFTSFINQMIAYYQNGIPNNMKNYQVDENGYLYKIYSIPWGICSIVAAIITAIIMGIMVKKNKMVAKASQAEEYLNRNSVNITNRKDTFVTSHTSSYTISSDSGGSGGGFSSHSGSSGGGHSSGGGRHG